MTSTGISEKKKSKVSSHLFNGGGGGGGSGSSKKGDRDSFSTDDENTNESNHLIQRSSSTDKIKRKLSKSAMKAIDVDYDKLKEAAAAAAKKTASGSANASKKKQLKEEVTRMEQQYLASLNDRLNTQEKRITILEAQLKKQESHIENLMNAIRTLTLELDRREEEGESHGGCLMSDWWS
jgi:hypothetical protein